MSTATSAAPRIGTPPRSRARIDADRSDVNRTLRTLLASALAVVPLCELFTDVGWLVDVWVAMLITIAPALVLRLRRPPNALQVWPGMILLVPWLTIRYVHENAVLGFIPWAGTWHDVSALMSALHTTTRDAAAPVHTTIAIKLTLCALLGLLAALIDLLAVVGRHGALAGIPLLIIYTVSGAVPRQPVSWLLFACSAAGFLLLLSVDAKTEVREWGHLIPRPGAARSRPILAVSGQQIAVISICLAVVIPLAAPARPANLIADALHSGGSSGHNSFGIGTGGSIDPFVALKGQLERSKPADLATVTITSRSGSAARPFYLRENVLSDYVANDGWAAGDHGPTTAAGSAEFATVPASSADVPTVGFSARITTSGMRGNPAIFARPVRLSGLDGAQWSARDQLMLGTQLRHGLTYQEQVSQPHPSVAELAAAPAAYGRTLARWLRLPDTPRYVDALVARLTTGMTGPYQKARAISDYFADPANGFSYSLSTESGDSGNALVDFLQNRQGYCQQYAAAMAVMLRVAAIPSRVVLGYTHKPPNKQGTFKITTNDAHAWVEAYFFGIGWIPFDPTPLAGINGGAANDLVWAPHSKAGTDNGTNAGPLPVPTLPHPRALPNPPANPPATAAPAAQAGDSWTLLWVVAALALLCLLAALPAGARVRRRRRRLNAGRLGDPDPLWTELSDTAVDLGYGWSPARSPRQVVDWLDRASGSASGSLRGLAAAVERARYGPAGRRGADRAGGTRLVAQLADVVKQLRAGQGSSSRIRGRLWPASLGWRLRRPRRRTGRRHSARRP